MTKDTQMKNTKGNTGNRYSDDQKREILAFIEKAGRGGISAAQDKYKVSYIAIRSWQDKGFGGKTMKRVLAQVPAKAKRGRPPMVRPATVHSNRPGRPQSNAKLAKMVANLRSTINKAETKFGELEKLLQPA